MLGKARGEVRMVVLDAYEPECFVRLGQRGRALRQYGLCEQALRDDYDMPPSPGTRALYASILKDGGFR